MRDAGFGKSRTVCSNVVKVDVSKLSKAPNGSDIRNLRMRIVSKRPIAPRMPNVRMKMVRGGTLIEPTKLILTPDTTDMPSLEHAPNAGGISFFEEQSV